MTSKSQKVDIGTRVIAGIAGKKGVVRFIGETEFSVGEWIGVALDTPDGKNDGSVGDVRYFNCPANHGLFLKRVQVKIDREEVITDSRDKIAVLRDKRKLRETASKDENDKEDVIFGVTSDSTSMTSTEVPVEPTVFITPTNTVYMESSTPSLPQSSILPSSPESFTQINPDPLPPMPPTPPPSTIRLSTTTLQMPHPPPQVAFNNLEQSGSMDQTETASGVSADCVTEQELVHLRRRLTEVEAALASALAREKEKDRGSQTPVSAVKDKAALAAQARRVLELEEQVSELTQNLELLALDKEQQAIELEAAEESIQALEAELAQLQLKASLSIQQAAAGPTVADAEVQNERLKEAILKLHQTTTAEIGALKTRVKELEGFEARAAEKSREVASLLSWQADAKERLEELSTRVDEASGYEALLEKLTETNIDLSEKNMQLAETVADLEASQEVMEELDGSQRAEIETIRRQMDSLTVQLRTADDAKKSQESKADELKQTVDRFRSMLDELRLENARLATQIAQDQSALQDVTGKNRETLSHKHSLVSQFARAAELSKLLRQSEVARRFAEARSARLEALLTLPQYGKEMRLFQWEAGLVRFLNRCALATEGLRSSLSGGGDEAVLATELLGDRLVRITVTARVTSDLTRLLGLLWTGVIVLSQTTSGFSGVGEEEGGSETSELCQQILVLERDATPLLNLLEEGEGVTSAVGVAAAQQLRESLASVIVTVSSSSYMTSAQLSGVLAGLLEGQTVSVNSLSHSSSAVVQRCVEAVNGSQMLALDGCAIGLSRVLELVSGGVSSQDPRLKIVVAARKGLEDLLGSIRSGLTSSSTTNNLPAGLMANEMDDSTSLLRPLSEVSSQAAAASVYLPFGLAKATEQLLGVLLAERSDFNCIAASSVGTGSATGAVSAAVSHACVLLSQVVADANIQAQVGPAATMSALLEASGAWAWLVDGRLREEGGSALVACTWRRRCRLLRDAVERSSVAAESLADLQLALSRVTVAEEERSEQLQASVRRVAELEDLLGKQKALLVAAEEAKHQVKARALKEDALQREVDVLREALEVLEGRLEAATQDSRRPLGQTQGAAGQAGAHWDAGMEGPHTTALRGALLVGRAWQSLVVKRLGSTLKPLPTLTTASTKAPLEVASPEQSGNISGELRKLLREVNGARASGAVVVRLKNVSPGSAANALIAQKIASERKASNLARRMASVCTSLQQPSVIAGLVTVTE